MVTAEKLVQLRHVRDVMDRRFAEHFDLRELATVAGYSRFHLVRSFRDAFGETPGAYFTRRRIERAKDLLRGANLTVTEVCFLVGFSSLGSFSSRFRELVGCSPSEYRDRQVATGGLPPVPGCFYLAWSRPRPAASQSATSKKQELPRGS
jgi:AraC-like DNA-binding protein